MKEEVTVQPDEFRRTVSILSGGCPVFQPEESRRPVPCMVSAMKVAGEFLHIKSEKTGKKLPNNVFRG